MRASIITPALAERRLAYGGGGDRTEIKTFEHLSDVFTIHHVFAVGRISGLLLVSVAVGVELGFRARLVDGD